MQLMKMKNIRFSFLAFIGNIEISIGSESDTFRLFELMWIQLFNTFYIAGNIQHNHFFPC